MRSERILRRIFVRGGLVPADLFRAEVLEDLEQRLAVVTERDRAVMREAVFDQHVTVEAAHFLDGEDADAAEGTRGDRKDLALRHVSVEVVVRGGLQAVEGDVAGNDVALERAMIIWYFISGLQSFFEQVLPQWKPMKVSWNL